MQQTQTAVQQRKRNLQDLLLSKLRRSRMGATVFLVNGFQIRGEIRGFDAFVVVIYSEGKQQMVYKHAISTVVPERPLSWEEDPLKRYYDRIQSKVSNRRAESDR